MLLKHPRLVGLLRRAYSAEKAAAFAYIGHARSVTDPDERAAIQRIEADEWSHRQEVRAIMQRHEVPVSRYYELKYHVIGKLISFSCHVIGRFMPFYFAGRLESGNVCEYFRMMRYFDELGISEHHQVLYEMGVKEKEHEVYFLRQLKTHRMLPVFEKLFAWGKHNSLNDVDLDAKYPVAESKAYCRKHNALPH
jgi:rubrerythrin